jgi:hypothetical protein
MIPATVLLIAAYGLLYTRPDLIPVVATGTGIVGAFIQILGLL